MKNEKVGNRLSVIGDRVIRIKFLSAAMCVLLLSAVTSGRALAEKWTPYQFKGNEHFEYELRSNAQAANFTLDIVKKKKGLFEVSSTSKWLVTKEELGVDILGGFWAGAGGVGLTMFFVDPMGGRLFGSLDLKVGEKMSFWGMGVVKIVGKEKIAGREGFVCQLIGQEDRLLMEWVIDPALPLPLSTKIFDNEGNVEYESKLLKYSTH